MTGTRQQFTAGDGAALQYKSWNAGPGASRALVLLHRGHEHADRWDPVVPGLALPDTAVYAWEARGHGQSPDPRGHASSFMRYVRDLDDFMRHLESVHGVKPERTVLLGHSVGAVVAAAWAHDYGPQLAGLVLATPALEVNLLVPGTLAGIRLLRKWKPDAVIKSYVKGSWLTRDHGAAASYDQDPLISRDISAGILTELFDAAARVTDDAAVMDRPLLLFSAGADRVVKRGAIEKFYRNYGGEIKTHLTLEGARHAVFHDFCRDEATAAVRTFAERCFAVPQPPRRNEDLSSPATVKEHGALQRPLPSPSLKALGYAVQRLAMGTAGRLSRGIRLGHATGFDSGESLDYVYENRAQGSLGPVGRMIDRAYLDAIGWRGIRQRRECLREALRAALRQTRERGLPAELMDIAGGAGRYLLDLLEEESGRTAHGGNAGTVPSALAAAMGAAAARSTREAGAEDAAADGPEALSGASGASSPLHVLCRDWSLSALAAGEAAAAARGLTGRITHRRGDAFSGESLAEVRPAPSVVVVSGLYELFPDNAAVAASLQGVARLLPAGGQLIYTGQPWHPQVEMIARTLTNREGRFWVMRRRPQQEMDALVRQAGLVKERQWTDDFGIFTVSLAVKPAAE